MKNCTIKKDGRKWIVIANDGKILFKGTTRVSCFRYCEENNIKITSYQHGGK